MKERIRRINKLNPRRKQIKTVVLDNADWEAICEVFNDLEKLINSDNPILVRKWHNGDMMVLRDAIKVLLEE